MADLFLDHNVALQLSLDLQRLGHATRTARQLGLERTHDDLLLLKAAEHRWTNVPILLDDEGDFFVLA